MRFMVVDNESLLLKTSDIFIHSKCHLGAARRELGILTVEGRLAAAKVAGTLVKEHKIYKSCTVQIALVWKHEHHHSLPPPVTVDDKVGTAR